MPAVGTFASFWNFYSSPQLLSTLAVDTSSNTIRSLDTSAGSFLRDQRTGVQDFTRPETLFINTPRNGYATRVGATVVASNNTSVTVSEFTSLPLRGMGMSALVLPTSKLFLFAVNQP